MADATPWGARSTSRLVVLLSSERSGSTLLRVMLGAHTRISAPQELFLLRYPTFDAWRAQKPDAMESVMELCFLLGHPRTEAEIEAACRGRAIADVYRWLFDVLPSGGLLLDKTPAYANEATTLLRSAVLAPFYIWLIRHPLGVIASHVRLKQEARRQRTRGAARRALSPLRAALERVAFGMPAVGRERETKWVVQNLNVYNFLRHIPPDQQATVHYEALVRAPESVLCDLCARIGVAFEPAVLQPHTRQRMNAHLGDPHFHQHAGVEAPPADAWRRQYDESQLRVETLQLMEQLGVTSPRLGPSAAAAAPPGARRPPHPEPPATRAAS